MLSGEALIRALHVGPIVQQEVDDVNVTVNLQGGASLARTAGALSRGQDSEAPCPSQLRGGPLLAAEPCPGAAPSPIRPCTPIPQAGFTGGKGEGSLSLRAVAQGPPGVRSLCMTLRWGAHSSGASTV